LVPGKSAGQRFVNLSILEVDKSYDREVLRAGTRLDVEQLG
jgi:hypothetical protein